MSARGTGGSAFPLHPGLFLRDGSGDEYMGMSLHDYAAIHFAAAWTQVLGTTQMRETREQRIDEANRLGLLQADAMLRARSAS